MKFLSQFTKFDFDRFSEGKEYMVVEAIPWLENNTKRLLGTTVSVVIITDKTQYSDVKPGNNRYEKLNFKVKKQVNVSPDTRVIPVNPIAKVYGDYNNLLSVTCDDIKVIEPSKGQK